jgi:hypothetical protein
MGCGVDSFCRVEVRKLCWPEMDSGGMNVMGRVGVEWDERMNGNGKYCNMIG